MDDTPDDASDAPNPKPRKAYKRGNTGPDGTYLIGKNRTPEHTRFAAGDGRKRGRRAKGQKNFDTEFLDEIGRLVTVRENGKERRVTKLRSTIIRALDNAGSKGQNPAIAGIFAHSARLAEKVVSNAPGLSATEDDLVNGFLAQRIAQLQLGDQPGDPEGDPEDGPEADQPTGDNEASDDE
jgi:hypothetical protein